MAANSNIEWTDSTVNFWWGCTKVGPGCDHCYAETWSKRTGESIWGVGAPRRKIKSAVALLHKLDNDYSWWAADHAIAGYHQTSRRRVFIQSMSDLFDLEVPVEWFAEAWQTIERCSRLHIQIVTKRISAVEKRLDAIGVTTWPQHAGLMITVCNQAEADRDIPRLLALKAKLCIPWVGLSMEPLLGPVDLTSIRPAGWGLAQFLDATNGSAPPSKTGAANLGLGQNGERVHLDWVIVGGESGPGARPMHPNWVKSLRDQCIAAEVPFFFKQWGEWHPWGPQPGGTLGDDIRKGVVIAVHPSGRDSVQVAEAAGGRTSEHGTRYMAKLGKKAAGRLLDGIEHNAMPRAFR